MKIDMFSPRQKAFTLIELLVVISIIALLIAILLPALASARVVAQQLRSSTHARGIHQGLAVSSQDNNGWYAGLDSKGRALEAGVDTGLGSRRGRGYFGWDFGIGNVGDGRHPARRYAALLDGEYVTPTYLLNPSEPKETAYVAALPGPGFFDGRVATPNYSYALLEIFSAPTSSNPSPTVEQLSRRDAWNIGGPGEAAILSDRNLQSSGTVDGPVSVWSEADNKPWTGTVTRNDGSTSFEPGQVIEGTRYGNGSRNDEDGLFIGETSSLDARMVYKDANSLGFQN